MAKGYVILTEDIHDPQAMKAYAGAARDPIHDHHGKVLVADQRPQVLEGEWFGNQTVVIEFESVEAARTWYESPEYQASPERLTRRALLCHRGAPPKPQGGQHAATHQAEVQPHEDHVRRPPRPRPGGCLAGR